MPFTPVEKGCKYFKLTFVEDPWLELETKLLAVNVKDEEVKLQLDDSDMEPVNLPNEGGKNLLVDENIRQEPDRTSEGLEASSQFENTP